MGIINVLDPQVANLIAAGEVVDRPASVVKELLENAIDAKATSVTVEIKHGGTTFIRVCDNGCGMSRDDVPVCLRRHATSKIKEEGDLDRIMTLGFRGEALAAIGAVATVRILTKQKQSAMGTQLTCVGGEIREIVESGCRDGTTIIVEELFANVPARRKFLKKDSSEALAVSAVVEKIALSRPDLSIKFISDNNVRFDTAGDGDLRSCIYAVLGREFAMKMLEVHGMTGGIEVKGFIGSPENVRANRNYQNFFINGRYVKSRTAMAAIEQAFNSYIPSDKFPVCVLEIKIHPALVDVNVHPSKLEVKFSNEQAVFDAVYSAVRSKLESSLKRPTLDLKTKDEARKEARVISAFVPVRSSLTDTQGKGEQLSFGMLEKKDEGAISDRHLYSEHEEAPPHLRFTRQGSQDISSAPIPYSFDSVSNSDIPLSAEKPAESYEKYIRTIEFEKPKAPLGEAFNKKSTESKGEIEKELNNEAKNPNSRINALSAQNDLPKQELHKITPQEEKQYEKEKQPEEKQTEYSVSSIPRSSASEEITELPEYKILGEAFNSYIIVESDGTLLMIDKHAAHERILFEDMKKNISSGADSQLLLLPITLRLSAEESDALSQYSDDIRATGFDFMVEGNGRDVSLTAVPTGLSNDQAETFFVTVTGQLASGTGSLAVTRGQFYEQALYQASCKAAIKAGRVYDEAHIEWICKQVLGNPAVRFCPHGRPVAFELSKGDIEHRFKRK